MPADAEPPLAVSRLNRLGLGPDIVWARSRRIDESSKSLGGREPTPEDEGPEIGVTVGGGVPDGSRLLMGDPVLRGLLIFNFRFSVESELGGPPCCRLIRRRRSNSEEVRCSRTMGSSSSTSGMGPQL